MGKRTFSCVKWLLTSFNLLFLLFGLAICGLGVWMLVSPNIIGSLIGKDLTPIISYIMLVIGGTIILISFCGCAGAGLENRCLLCLFFTVLCGIFVACVVVSILVAIFKADLEKLTGDKFVENVKENYGVNNAWTQFWDEVQSRLSCCGVRDANPEQIYLKTKWYNNKKTEKVPLSCCVQREDGKARNPEECQKGNNKEVFQTGCMNKAIHIVVQQMIVSILVLVSVIVLLVAGMVLSLVHLRNINHHNRLHYTEYSRPL